MRTRSKGISPGGVKSLPNTTTRKTKKFHAQFEQSFPLEATPTSSTLEEADAATEKCKNYPFCGSLVPASQTPLTSLSAEPRRSVSPIMEFAKSSLTADLEEVAQASLRHTLPMVQTASPFVEAHPFVGATQHATPPQLAAIPQPESVQNTSWFSLSNWITTPLRSIVAAPFKGTSSPVETRPTVTGTPKEYPNKPQSIYNTSIVDNIPILPLPAHSSVSTPYNPHRSIFSDKESSYASPKQKTQAEVEAQLQKEADEITTRVQAEMAGTPTPKASKKATHHNNTEESIPGQKRKLAAIDGMLPGPKTGGFGIDDSYLDLDNEIEDFDESTFDTPVTKKVKMNTSTAQTPKQLPRSALRIHGNDSITRSAKNVKFNRQPLTGSRPVQPTYGRSGQYTGSVFADAPQPFSLSPTSTVPTPSTVRSDVESANLFSQNTTTRFNSFLSTPDILMSTELSDDSPHNAVDFKLRDPQDPTWRPQAHNPRPGQFCLPDDLSDYDEDGDSVMEQQHATEQQTTAAVNASPPTPRMAHAELPGTPTPSTTSSRSEAVLADIGSSALNKVRATAEKYKPESVGRHGSSKLSQVTQARSRSSSPPQNEARDENGIKADEREHQFDEWAATLDWPEPGHHITDEEVFNTDMMGRVREEWMVEDGAQSERFWNNEFDSVIANGRRGPIRLH